jgi:hypothetical protein
MRGKPSSRRSGVRRKLGCYTVNAKIEIAREYVGKRNDDGFSLRKFAAEKSIKHSTIIGWVNLYERGVLTELISSKSLTRRGSERFRQGREKFTVIEEKFIKYIKKQLVSHPERAQNGWMSLTTLKKCADKAADVLLSLGNITENSRKKFKASRTWLKSILDCNGLSVSSMPDAFDAGMDAGEDEGGMPDAFDAGMDAGEDEGGMPDAFDAGMDAGEDEGGMPDAFDAIEEEMNADKDEEENDGEDEEHHQAELQAFFDQLRAMRYWPLSEEEHNLVDGILRGPDNHEVVIDKFNVEMTRNKMLCLKPFTWLNDEVLSPRKAYLFVCFYCYYFMVFSFSLVSHSIASILGDQFLHEHVEGARRGALCRKPRPPGLLVLQLVLLREAVRQREQIQLR